MPPPFIASVLCDRFTGSTRAHPGRRRGVPLALVDPLPAGVVTA